MYRVLPLLVLCCSSCATIAPPVKVGDSRWTLSGTDSWVVSRRDAVLERLSHQAAAHCAEHGETVELVDATSTKPYGRPAQASITYECINEARELEAASATAEADEAD